jgi:predicted porin
MKKSLVALAALAATSAFAQSSVTLSGNLDFAYANVGGTQLIAKGSTVSSTIGTASTSVINIRAVEDLGGGMKATAHYGLDPRTLVNDSVGTTNNTFGTVSATATNTTGTTVTGLGRDEAFIGIEGGFGNLRLGAPNSIGLNSFQVAAPMGTGIGSGYTGGTTASTMTNSWVNTRYSRSVRYDSPSFNGIQFSYLRAPGNDQPAVAAATTTSGGQSALLIPNARAATEMGLRYDKGPVSVSYANVKTESQDNKGGWYAQGSSVQGTASTSVNMVNASYNMGTTTLYAGWNDGEQTTAGSTAVKTKGNRYAIKQTFGAMDLMATVTNQTSGTTDTKAKVTGLRGDYNFSKTAALYIGYEKWDTGTAYNASATTGDRKITSMGLKKSF